MKLYFSEKQNFGSAWILILFALINGLFMYGLFQQVILGKPWGNNPGSDLMLYVVVGCTLVFTIWFWNIKLIVKVLEDGIYIKFYMMWVKYKVIEFKQIETCKVRKYSATKEFGGWGIKGRKHKKAYTTSGKYGVQLELKKGKLVLIGTQKPDGLAQAIEKNLVKI